MVAKAFVEFTGNTAIEFELNPEVELDTEVDAAEKKHDTNTTAIAVVAKRGWWRDIKLDTNNTGRHNKNEICFYCRSEVYLQFPGFEFRFLRFSFFNFRSMRLLK